MSDLERQLADANARIAELEARDRIADTPIELAVETLTKRIGELEHELYGTKDSLKLVGDLRARYRTERDAARAALNRVAALADEFQYEHERWFADPRRTFGEASRIMTRFEFELRAALATDAAPADADGASEMNGGASAGTCRACGRDLVHVPGERTYHPHTVDLAAETCPALLPIGCPCECFSSYVPESEFIPAEDGGDR